MNKEHIRHIYFLGIGGIGMSSLARYFHSKGVNISGYDRTATPLTKALEKEGMQIHYTENPELIPDNIDLVIYTPAIPSDNKEFEYLIEKNLPLKKRSEMLGSLSEDQYTLAIAGTHGKTTVCSMIAHLLKSNNYKITALIGGISRNYNTNLIHDNNSEILILEADEFDRSFLQLKPDVAIITSIDADHLDIYKNKNNLSSGFKKFIAQIKKGGYLIINKNLREIAKDYKGKIITYSIKQKSDYYLISYKIINRDYYLNISFQDSTIENIKIQTPGNHNIENALAAIAFADDYGLNGNRIKAAFASYTGVERRFEYVVKSGDHIFIDDYAHHPEELKSCISTVRKLYPDKKITGIFQPHLYSRTRDFIDDFARSLELLDELILLNIYPAREKPIEGINSEMLLDKIQIINKKLLSKDETIDYIKHNKPEVLVTLGAGDIDQIVEPIKNILIES